MNANLNGGEKSREPVLLFDSAVIVSFCFYLRHDADALRDVRIHRAKVANLSGSRCAIPVGLSLRVSCVRT